MMECSFGGQLIFFRSWNSPLLLTTSNTFVRSMKVNKSDSFCSWYFSCSCCMEKIISIVDVPALNLHWDSGYMHIAKTCKNNWAKTSLANNCQRCSTGRCPDSFCSCCGCHCTESSILVPRISLWYCTEPSFQHRLCSSCRSSISSAFLALITSPGMPSSPGNLREAVVPLWAPRPVLDNWQMASSAASVMTFCVEYSLRKCSTHCFFWSVMFSPDLVFSVMLLVAVGLEACLMPVYMLLVLT